MKRKKTTYKFQPLGSLILIYVILLFLGLGGCKESGRSPAESQRIKAAPMGLGMDAATEDSIRLEQAIADFSELMKYADDEARAKAMQELVDEYAGSEEDMSRIDRLIRKYLADPNSPQRDEDIFILYLQTVAASSAAPQHIAERALFSLSEAMLNRPGSEAADFTILLRRDDDRNEPSTSPIRSTFRKTIPQDTTLVIFHDPDCQQCRKLISTLTSTPKREGMRILAVDVTSDRERWLRNEHPLPAGWKDAFAVTPIEENGLYAFPALPSIYLLSPDGKVILKDFNPNF